MTTDNYTLNQRLFDEEVRELVRTATSLDDESKAGILLTIEEELRNAAARERIGLEG